MDKIASETELYKGLDLRKIKKYGIPAAVVGGVAAVFFTAISFLNDYKDEGEETMKNLTPAAITETTQDMEERGVGLSKKSPLASYEGIVNKKGERDAKYADWDWDPKELSVEKARELLIRDYELPEDSKILKIIKVRDQEDLKQLSIYFERMDYDMKMAYDVKYDDGGLGNYYTIFYAGGEWGGMPYFKEKWEKLKK
jgi:hypothetical protein